MDVKILSWNIWCDGHFDEIAKFLNRRDTSAFGRTCKSCKDTTRLTHYTISIEITNQDLKEKTTPETTEKIKKTFTQLREKARKLQKEEMLKNMPIKTNIIILELWQIIFYPFLR